MSQRAPRPAPLERSDAIERAGIAPLAASKPLEARPRSRPRRPMEVMGSRPDVEKTICTRVARRAWG